MSNLVMKEIGKFLTSWVCQLGFNCAEQENILLSNSEDQQRTFLQMILICWNM